MIRQDVVATGTGIYQQAKLVRGLAWRRKRRQRPRIAQCAPVRIDKLKAISASGFEIRGIERPEVPLRIAGAAAQLAAGNHQQGRGAECLLERRLDEDALIVRSRNQMRYGTRVPAGVVARRCNRGPCGRREGDA